MESGTQEFFQCYQDFVNRHSPDIQIKDYKKRNWSCHRVDGPETPFNQITRFVTVHALEIATLKEKLTDIEINSPRI